MNREEERNVIAHEIAWQHTKHYDPLLSKESWCEMAAREAIDWSDKTIIDKACKFINQLCDGFSIKDNIIGLSYTKEELLKDFKKAMEE